MFQGLKHPLTEPAKTRDTFWVTTLCQLQLAG